MNNPKKYNGWTQPMMTAMTNSLLAAGSDPNTKVAIVTAADPYYCAGVDLSGSIQLMAPSKLHNAIYTSNKALFDQYLNFPKPIIVAVNGPAIGASVTSATLCDAVIASKKATFTTPFHRLGVTPEGCSSVHFKKLMGPDVAERMLGKEGWQPTGDEAAKVGLVTKCVAHEDLEKEAVMLAQQWIKEGRVGRSHMGEKDTKMLLEVNRKESLDLATAFLSEKFLNAQVTFLESKGKSATLFKVLIALRPIWSKFI